MAYWRDPTRPVKWTKEGKLVYVTLPSQDDLLVNLKARLRNIINNWHDTSVGHKRLRRVIRAITQREKEIKDS